MIYTLIIFSLFAVAVLLYAGNTFNWIVDQKIESPFIVPYDRPMIIEKRYNAHPFMAHFQYTRSEHEILNEERREAIVRRFTHTLCEQIIKEGFVEIKDQEDYLMPYFRRMEFRVMVYKEEDRISKSFCEGYEAQYKGNQK